VCSGYEVSINSSILHSNGSSTRRIFPLLHGGNVEDGCKTLIQISSKPRAPSYTKLNIPVLGGSLNLYSTVDFSSLIISESKNHQFWFLEKIGIKEPWVLVIPKSFKNRQFS
jgi:hypothetical protein